LLRAYRQCCPPCFFPLLLLPPPRSPLFPYTTLFRSSRTKTRGLTSSAPFFSALRFFFSSFLCCFSSSLRRCSGRISWRRSSLSADRKSTRLNSSHVKISYAVFCLKKKNK